MMAATSEPCCADTFQSRASGSFSELTRIAFVRRIVEAQFCFSAASDRLVAGVNSMIVAFERRG